jgi:capsular polysaccharide biosynthesis protein
MSQSAASSVADIVAGIATDRTQLGSVLHDVGADRSADAFVRGLSVRAIGSSGIVDLSVTDNDPVIAAAVANALTARVVQVMRETHAARYPLPIVIADATPSITAPPRAIPSMWRQYVALGALFGLVLGVVGAALLEALRPTMVGKEAIAAELGAPVLGVLRGGTRSRDVSLVRWQLAAQAKRIGVGVVQLAGAGPSIDLLALSAALAAPGEASNRLVLARAWRGWKVRGQAHDGHSSDLTSRFLLPGGSNLEIGVFDQTTALSVFPNGVTGLVVVTPTAIKRTALEPMKNLLTVTGWPPLGVITYRRSRTARLVRAPANLAKVIRRNGHAGREPSSSGASSPDKVEVAEEVSTSAASPRDEMRAAGGTRRKISARNDPARSGVSSRDE